MKFLTPEVRQYLYPVAIAVVAILVAYGVLNQEQAAVWIGLVTAVLGLSLATANVKPSTRDDVHDNPKF